MAVKKKPTKKKNTRRTELQSEKQLEEAQTQATKVKPAENQVKVSIGAESLRSVVGETMARVYEEIWPRMAVRDRFENPDTEVSEETYILVNTMVVGNPLDTPRTGLKIREHDTSTGAKFCKEHK